MRDFRTTALAPRITRIKAPCGEMMYLLEGEEKAALIDSGTGYGSLLAVVRRLTDKPVILLLTHGHIDHAMGTGEFSQVWMSPRDLDIYRLHSSAAFRQAELKNAPGGGADVPEMRPAADPNRLRPLAEGDVFDLGGVSLEAFACPGHTPGSMVFLCREERVLFSGDAFSNSTLILGFGCLTVEEYLESLLALIPKLGDSFDRVFEAHSTGELPKGILLGVAEVCRDVLLGKSEKIPCVFRGLSGFFARKKDAFSTGQVGNLLYDEQHLYRKEKL